MKKQWKKFDELCEKCYLNMMGANKEDGVWDEAFDILLDIISTGRESNPNYAKELVELDDSTDFSHDIGGWLEDYLDELDMRRQFDRLLEVGGKLLDLFFWEDENRLIYVFVWRQHWESRGTPGRHLIFVRSGIRRKKIIRWRQQH